MPWKGYNYEDAIVLNERVVREDLLTSVHVDEYILEVRETKRGMEELTSDIPNVSEEATKDLDENGIQISGGEAQKIAIARALYKDAPFIILDDPTAALDPVAEAEIYSKFNDIVTDKTTVYISHRLSSCKFCDEIAVFHEGNVVQKGTHEELISDKSGKYYELWNAQAQYYNE